MRLKFLLPAAFAVLAAPALAGQVSFSGWEEQRFALFSKVNFSGQGARLSIAADDAASLTYSRLPRSEWGARAASWTWAVQQSVPATDLTRKGGDDRNIALYFVFLPEARAEALSGARVSRLLQQDDVRTLVYVWGGSHGRGARLSSPYLGPRGQTVVLRGVGTGQARENVDLAGDYARAFGGAPGALVGLAVSADSDDTDSRIRAVVEGLALR